MSKYGALARYLSNLPQQEVRLSFDEIEKVLEAKLPTSARSHRAWWSNNSDNSVMTKAWLDAGWRSEQVDMANESLVFRRTGKHNDNRGQDSASAGQRASKPLFGGLKGTVRIIADVTLPLDEIWSANEERV
ncbi:DUF7662 domain-containing protein [Bosea sp. LjRoot237]|uniref:DUF7662 domain-containing protein n=1 Tax=Bosea sp. LjRoot237 TaxID=3342292 RepID=UPI003ED1357D